MSTEDEIIRIAKKMDKMVQKKNAVSGSSGVAELERRQQAHRALGLNFCRANQRRRALSRVPAFFLRGRDEGRMEGRQARLACGSLWETSKLSPMGRGFESPRFARQLWGLSACVIGGAISPGHREPLRHFQNRSQDKNPIGFPRCLYGE